MSTFFNKLAEELRTKEKLLEDHNDHPVFKREDAGSFEEQLHGLKKRLDDMNKRIDDALKKGSDVDEHLKESIGDAHNKLTVEIDTFIKNIRDEKE